MAKAKKRTYEYKAEILPGLRLEPQPPKVDPRTNKQPDATSGSKTGSWQDEATIHRLIDFFKGF